MSVDYDRNPSGEPYRITREDGTFVLYGYDSALRLTSERYFDATSTQVDAITYSYDDDGNRTSRTTSAGTEIYHYAEGSELTDITIGTTLIAHYDYDDAGRVVHRTRGMVEQQLDYDADDHLVRIADPAGTNEVLWDFDGMGRRVRREDRSGGVTTIVRRFEVAPTLSESLESIHAAIDDPGNARLEYVFSGEHPLFRYDPDTSEATYYLQDAMGSVLGLVAAAGASTIHYDGFGDELRTTGTLVVPSADARGDFRYQGMWRDTGTGFYYVRARTYESEIGRFSTRDARPGRPGVVESSQPFTFATSSPTVARDPTGLAPSTLGELAIANVVQATLVNLAVAAVRNTLRAFCGRFDRQLLADDIYRAVRDGIVEGVLSTVLGARLSGVARSIVEALAFSLIQPLLDTIVDEQRLANYPEIVQAMWTLGGSLEAALLEASVDGDEESWGELVETVFDSVFQSIQQVDAEVEWRNGSLQCRATPGP